MRENPLQNTEIRTNWRLNFVRDLDAKLARQLKAPRWSNHGSIAEEKLQEMAVPSAFGPASERFASALGRSVSESCNVVRGLLATPPRGPRFTCYKVTILLKIRELSAIRQAGARHLLVSRRSRWKRSVVATTRWFESSSPV
jgi:hypothetical protein